MFFRRMRLQLAAVRRSSPLGRPAARGVPATRRADLLAFFAFHRCVRLVSIRLRHLPEDLPLKRTLRWVSVAALAMASAACESNSGSVYNAPTGPRTASAPRKSG